MTIAMGCAAACSLLMLIVVALLVNPVGASALVAVVSGLFFVLRPLTRRARRQATARSSGESGVAASVDELVRTAEEIRVHGVGEAEKARLFQDSTNVAGWVTRLTFTSLSVSHFYQGAALGLIVCALFVVNQLGAGGAASAGAIILILLRAFAYSQQLQQSYHQASERATSVAAVDEKLVLYRNNAKRVGEDPLTQIQTLAFQDVSYSYRDDRQALSHVTFSVAGRQVVGVVGPSGAGKSTLVQLLLRLRSPDSGEYLINGKAASCYDDGDWTRLVTYLPQRPQLVTGSVYENIRFLRDVGIEAVQEAARQAHLHEEIMTWPAGYDTVIGPSAGALSGGQAQRLCLARALITKPQLLVLDEPTSALDAQSEYHVQKALEELRDETTMFIIAHRLSTLTICDRLLVLKDGRVEGFDTREALARSGGFYHDALRMSGLA